MGRKWFQLVDHDGRPLGPLTTATVDMEVVADFRHAVLAANVHHLAHIDMFELTVFANRAAFDAGRALAAGAAIVDCGNDPHDPLLVVVPPLRQERATRLVPSAVVPSDVVWFGACGLRKSWDDLGDTRTLPRSALVATVLEQLETNRVVVVTGPQQSGKTTLAALVCRAVAQQQPTSRVAIASLTALAWADHESFGDAFHRQCGLEWEALLTMATCSYTVYIVVDEAQVLYDWNGRPTPVPNASVLWELLKLLSSRTTLRVRVLLLAGYAWSLEIFRPFVVGPDQLYLTADEIRECVATWFRGHTSLDEAAQSSAFCALLATLTGGHIGLCVTAIQALNEVFWSHRRRGRDEPTANDWLRMLATGTLDGRPRTLYTALTMTRAVDVMDALDHNDLVVLERLVYGEVNDDDDNDDNATRERCVRYGVLVHTADGTLDFASPVLWRRFVELRVRGVARATTMATPATLAELVRCVLRAMDYTRLRHAVMTAHDPYVRMTRALERAWQLELYKAVYRSTPFPWTTAIDAGALFGSPGFLAFTVHRPNDGRVWGMDVRRDSRSTGAARFAQELLTLDDWCELEFRCVAAIDDAIATEGEDTTQQQRYVVCYDRELAHAAVLCGASRWSLV